MTNATLRSERATALSEQRYANVVICRRYFRTARFIGFKAGGRKFEKALAFLFVKRACARSGLVGERPAVQPPDALEDKAVELFEAVEDLLACRRDDPSFHEIDRRLGKALVEGGVRIAETWVAAKLRNEVFHSFAELNEAIAAAVEDIDARPFQVREGSRISQFEAEEKGRLKPLPAQRFETSEWRQAKLAPDYHVQADCMRCSAPAKFIGKTFDVRLTSTTVTLYIDGAPIAKHTRLYGRKGQYSTDTLHMPEAHRRFSGAWTPLYFQRWAGSVGRECGLLIDGILGSKAIQEQAFVPCANIPGLSKRGKRDLLEAACAQVNELGGIASYTRVKQAMSSIDQSRKRMGQTQATVAEDLLGEGGRTRGASYYARKGR